MLLLKLLDGLGEDGWTVYASLDQKATLDNDTSETDALSSLIQRILLIGGNIVDSGIAVARELGETNPSLPQLKNTQRHKVVATGTIWRRCPGSKYSDTNVLDYPAQPVP